MQAASRGGAGRAPSPDTAVWSRRGGARASAPPGGGAGRAPPLPRRGDAAAPHRRVRPGPRFCIFMLIYSTQIWRWSSRHKHSLGHINERQ
ncbi:hypothetical protein BDA96_08G124100 [Sorghum bicolor]|uniref:Uncharacterized protein n=2 Tax=Sorghum bicolor TaxID=4558 RepID=A0A921QEX4_SORBI|nr:hypothetical protein BDA96_08G124100 [Sorghum bicolor]KXG23569.1 hypothetical protein SORBI_3008G111200 [Sorghum bicolor]